MAFRMRKFLKLYDSMPIASQDALSFALNVVAAGLGITVAEDVAEAEVSETDESTSKQTKKKTNKQVV